MISEVRQKRTVRCVQFVTSSDELFWSAMERGQWEPGTLDVFDRMVVPGVTVVDMGAWVGPLTLYAASLGAQVVAIEPDPVAAERLRSNIALNSSLAPRIRVFEKAMSAAADTVELYSNAPGERMSSLLGHNTKHSWTVSTLTPQELVSLLANAERLFFKIDIEGAEYSVVPAMMPFWERGAAALISLHPQFVEDRRSQRIRKLSQDLFACFRKYTAQRIRGKGEAVETPRFGAVFERRAFPKAPRHCWLFTRSA